LRDPGGPSKLRLGLVVDADATLVLWTFELYLTIDQRIDRMIVAHADVDAGVELGAALTDDDGARLDDLATVLLHTKHLRLGISTVTG